jgi:RNA polymerase sigma-70 factor, ECF subfamily
MTVSTASLLATSFCTAPGARVIMSASMARRNDDDDRERRFRAMFDLSYPFVRRVLRRFGVPEAAIDDAAQEVFVVAARKLDAIAADKERSFLYGTARRVAADVRRSRGRAPATDSDSILVGHPDVAPSPEQLTVQSEARALLDRVLDAMGDDERDVFVLFELEGLAKSEVAVALGIPEGTAVSRLRRAREIFFATTEGLDAGLSNRNEARGSEQ